MTAFGLGERYLGKRCCLYACCWSEKTFLWRFSYLKACFQTSPSAPYAIYVPVAAPFVSTLLLCHKISFSRPLEIHPSFCSDAFFRGCLFADCLL